MGGPRLTASHVFSSAAFWFQRRSSRPGAATTKAPVEPALKRGEAWFKGYFMRAADKVGHNSTSKGVKEPQ